MHGGVFQIKVPVHYAWWSLSNESSLYTNAWWSLSNESPCTQCMAESFAFQLKSLYTMHGGVFQIKVPVHNAWWSLSN